MVAELKKINYEDNDGFMAKYVSGSDGYWHFHPEYEIVLNINNNGTRIVGDSVELFDNNDLVLIGGNIPHSWNYCKDTNGTYQGRGIMVHFNLSSIGEALLAQHELHLVRKLLIDSGRGLHFSVDDALLTEPYLINMINARGIEKMISFFNVLSIMCSSEKNSHLCSETYKRVFDKRNNKRMTDIFTYVRDNFSRPITLEDASLVAKMSPFAFSRYFKRYSGEGFVEYLNKVRMEKALHLLRETEYQIHDIAGQCGFSSISNFNKQFLRAEGLSPSKYRGSFRKTT